MTEELNCSEGARMLIERMQTHPQDFKHGGRFRWVFEKTMGLTPKGHYEISDRDDDALTAAMEKYILEPWLTETVVDEIFNGDRLRQEQKEREQQDLNARYANSLAASMASTKNHLAAGMFTGFSDPRVMSPGGVFNPAQGQVLWTEQEKQKRTSIFDEIRRKLKREPK